MRAGGVDGRGNIPRAARLPGEAEMARVCGDGFSNALRRCGRAARPGCSRAGVGAPVVPESRCDVADGAAAICGAGPEDRGELAPVASGEEAVAELPVPTGTGARCPSGAVVWLCTGVAAVGTTPKVVGGLLCWTRDAMPTMTGTPLNWRYAV